MLLKFCLSSILISTLLLAVNGIPQQIIAAGSQVGLQIGAGASYRGKYIGPLQPRQHKVSGEVYAVDARTLHIKGFTYSGTGPDAFFWTGFTENPSSQGIIVADEKSTKEVLGAYNNQDITITLPDGLTLRDIKWFGVWCRQYEVNFGDLYIPADFDFPQPHVIGSLAGQHGVSSGPIVVIDAQTILVPDFSYDGQAPDVHFWVGKGKPGPEGHRVASDTGGEEPLVKSDKKTMVLSLPGDLTIFDIDFFGVWCRLYYVDFGHVKIPPMINVPPSLRMLNLTPQQLAIITNPPPPRTIFNVNGQPVVGAAPQTVQFIPVSGQQGLTALYHPMYFNANQYVYQPMGEHPVDLSPLNIQPQQPQFQHEIHYPQQQQQQQQQVVFNSDHLAYQSVPQHPHQVLLQNNNPNLEQIQAYQQQQLREPVVHHTQISNIENFKLQPQHVQIPQGSNGFSTFTIKTSKGSSTAVSIY